MIDESELRQKLAAVVEGHIALEGFERWFGPASSNAHKDSSRGAIELVSAIHFLLSERDAGLSEVVLRGDLVALLNDVRRSVVFSPGDSSRVAIESRYSSSPMLWVGDRLQLRPALA